MYAIIKAGHRQFRVRAGTILRVTSFLKSDRGKESIHFPVVAAEEGSGIVLGTPFVEEAQVVAVVLREGRTKKVLVFKKKRRKGYRRTKGHRQDFIEVKIAEIKFPSGKVEKAPAPVAKVAKPVAKVAKPVAKVAKPVAKVAKPVVKVAKPVVKAKSSKADSPSVKTVKTVKKPTTQSKSTKKG